MENKFSLWIKFVFFTGLLYAIFLNPLFGQDSIKQKNEIRKGVPIFIPYEKGRPDGSIGRIEMNYDTIIKSIERIETSEQKELLVDDTVKDGVIYYISKKRELVLPDYSIHLLHATYDISPNRKVAGIIEQNRYYFDTTINTIHIYDSLNEKIFKLHGGRIIVSNDGCFMLLRFYREAGAVKVYSSDGIEKFNTGYQFQNDGFRGDFSPNGLIFAFIASSTGKDSRKDYNLEIFSADFEKIGSYHFYSPNTRFVNIGIEVKNDTIIVKQLYFNEGNNHSIMTFVFDKFGNLLERREEWE